MSAPNWDEGQVLSWSGKWHVPLSLDGLSSEPRAMCGAHGYTQNAVPKYVRRLLRIASGEVKAPACKSCARILKAAAV